MKKPIYITTSIAYVNAEPHIGFLYELLAADVLKRYHQLNGEQVYFVTGTDEHGIKIAQAAEAAGQSPQDYVDGTSEKFKDLSEFSIDYDYFVRTTDPAHKKFVQEKWLALAEKGALKKKAYTGFYCSGCEAFKTEGEAEDGKCPIHERVLDKVEEENWFLIIDASTKAAIAEWINRAVFPITRRQEVLNVLESGAYDAVSVSRSKEKLSWGVPVPGDETQTMYVWVDALFSYISALKINGKEDLWPADIQIIGKDILKFHAIIWPALLLATGYELPKQLLVHGFINSDGKKMSKSLGNVITPPQLKERYGVEATRYLLFRQLSFYDDSNFVWSEFDALYNGELANGLGNLVARIIGLSKKIPKESFEFDKWLTNHDIKKVEHFAALLAKDIVNFQSEIKVIDEKKGDTLVGRADEFVSKHELWLDTDKKSQEVLAVLNLLLEVIGRLEPYLPITTSEARSQLEALDSKPLFPRLQN